MTGFFGKILGGGPEAGGQQFGEVGRINEAGVILELGSAQDINRIIEIVSEPNTAGFLHNRMERGKVNDLQRSIADAVFRVVGCDQDLQFQRMVEAAGEKDNHAISTLKTTLDQAFHTSKNIPQFGSEDDLLVFMRSPIARVLFGQDDKSAKRYWFNTFLISTLLRLGSGREAAASPAPPVPPSPPATPLAVGYQAASTVSPQAVGPASLASDQIAPPPTLRSPSQVGPAYWLAPVSPAAERIPPPPRPRASTLQADTGPSQTVGEPQEIRSVDDLGENFDQKFAALEAEIGRLNEDHSGADAKLGEASLAIDEGRRIKEELRQLLKNVLTTISERDATIQDLHYQLDDKDAEIQRQADEIRQLLEAAQADTSTQAEGPGGRGLDLEQLIASLPPGSHESPGS